MKETRDIIPAPLRDATEIERVFDPQIVPTGRYPSYRNVYTGDGLQLLDYWRAIRKRLWLILGITVLITTWTAIYMARKPNVYQATAVVQVDLEQTNPDLITSESRRQVANPDPAYFNTQLQLLGSDSLLRRVIKEHNLDTNKALQTAKTENSVSAWRSMLNSLGLASDDKKTATEVTDAVQNDNSLISSDEIAEAVRLSPCRADPPARHPIRLGMNCRFPGMLFSPATLSRPGQPSDPETSPLVPARCTGDTAVHLMAHRLLPDLRRPRTRIP